MLTTKPHHLLLSLTILTFSVSLAIAEGINCNDASVKKHFQHFQPCHGFSGHGGTQHEQSSLLQAINDAVDTTVYKDGQNIACVPGGTTDGINGAICAWVWNTQNTTTGAQVKAVAPLIKEHGCKLCGSAPIIQGPNDLSTGEVTFGWSWNENGCDGLCNEYGSSDFTPGNVVPGAGT